MRKPTLCKRGRVMRKSTLYMARVMRKPTLCTGMSHEKINLIHGTGHEKTYFMFVGRVIRKINLCL